MKKRSDVRDTARKKQPSSKPTSESRRKPDGAGKRSYERSAPLWLRAAPDFPLLNRRALAGLAMTSLVVCIVGLIAFQSSLVYLLSPSSEQKVLVTEDLENGDLSSKSATISGRPVRTNFGLATAPGNTWQVTWSGECEPGAIPFVRLHAQAGGPLNSSLIFRLGNQVTTVTVARPASGALIVPQGLTPGATSYSVTFQATLDARAKSPVLALDRVVVGSQVVPVGTLDGSMYLILWAALAPALVYFIIASISRKPRIAIGGVVIATIAVIAVLMTAPKIMMGLYAAILILYLPCLVSQRFASNLAARRSIDWLGALAFCALIFAPRWNFLMHNLSAPIAADSLDYMQIARDMSHPFDTRYREPFFIWVTKIWLSITAWSPMMMRVLTLILAYLEAVATWKLMRLFASPLIACAVTIALMLNPALIASSIQGLREELFPMILLAHTYFCITFTRDKKSWRFWTLVVLSGIVPLIRLSGLPYIIVALALTFWKTRTQWRRIAIASAIVIGMILPTAIYQAAKYGEPFYSSNGYVATFYRNMEFKGQPGYPTAEEVAKNPWAGERVSMVHYVLKMHSFSDVLSKSVAGAWSLVAGKSARQELLRLNPAVQTNYKGWPILPQSPPKLFELVLVLLFVGGCIYALFRSDAWFLLVHLLLLQLPLAYLLGANLLHWRLIMNGIPIMLVIAGLALQGLWLLMQRITRNESSPAQT